MFKRKLILAGISTAIVAVVFALTTRGSDTSLVDEEITSLVKQYDDAIYIKLGRRAAKNAANKILKLANQSSSPNETKVRGKIRLIYANIATGKLDARWKKKFKRLESLISGKPTIARAELLLYSADLLIREGLKRERKGDYEDGLKLAREVLEIAEQLKNDRCLALAYTISAELHKHLDHPNLVVGNAYSAFAVADHYGEKSIRIVVLRNLLADMMYVGEFAEAAKVGEKLHELSPNSTVAYYPLFLAGKSSNFEKGVKSFKKLIDQRIRKTGGVSVSSQKKLGKLLTILAKAYFIRKEFAKCRETCEQAIPHLEAVNDSVNLRSCLAHLKFANLEFASDAGSIDDIAAGVNNTAEAVLYADTIAAAYAELGEKEKSLNWREKAIDARAESQSELLTHVQHASKLHWKSELNIRKEIELNNKATAESHARVCLLSAALALGLTVCTLLTGFYYLLHRKSNSLESIVEARTKSLVKAMQESHAADHAKSEFLSHINHEIRNPLTAILGYCELLSLSNEDSNEFVSGIEASSLHLRELVDKILEVSKIESDGLNAQLVEFFPSQTVKDIHGIMAKQAAKKGLDFECNFEKDSSCLILSDEIKIRQIALNLIGNAIKFTETGSVTASLELKGLDDPSGAELVIDVNDTGIGIAADQIQTVFERFTKASNAVNLDGSGLGLFITKRLVECMDGEMMLDSSLGIGTHVRATLPIEVIGVSSDNPKRMSTTQSRDLYDSQVLSGKRVLVVDDQEIIRDTLKLQLQSCGLDCKVDWELNRTIQLVESWHPDLVLLDLRMPKHSGFDVLEQIRNSKASSVPVYAMTGDATVNVQQKCLSVGFDGFITKPFQMSSVLKILESTSATGLSNFEA